MGALIHCKFDKFHRVIRDIKLAMARCCSSLFVKAQLYTTFIWGPGRTASHVDRRVATGNVVRPSRHSL